MTAPAAVLDLVQRFESNRAAYHAGHYNETQLRREFLDPFFAALGWDVDNRQGYAEPYKDVIHEDALKIGGATKAPDYCFRIGGARKFFLEAKKPAVNLRDDVSAAYQLRRYAWSAKLPLSILSDFEEFAVYDCRARPDKTDKPAAGRILYLGYRDYPARWEEIAGVFAKEAILRGAFDRYAESAAGKRGTAAVDAAFLAEIEGWRDTLARALALRNPGLTQRELNQAVQATIDRIIFLRIAEDRGIEGYGKLLALTNGSQIYARLTDLFREADARYNSGLFHFAAEAERPDGADSLTLGLTLDDKPLKELLAGLYYPDSPYEFSVLSADILGQVYEQFLGRVIRLTPGHQAKVEDKPEVKKAGGVFYTPTYIVDAIVKQTVGPLLAGRTVEEIGQRMTADKRMKASRGKAAQVSENLGRPASLRIADIACGSGSFLLGAYQYLLDWYRERYLERLAHSAGANRQFANLPIYQSSGGEWRLTTAERKRILLAHIYGVDIDPQAVEVTRLSLLLKVLEGASAETLGAQLRLFQERALPDLARNIKCGNSLIGPEFYDGLQLGLLDEEERYRINAFDWAAEFGSGFDAIIGNPPYIRIQMLKEWAPREVEYYKRVYASAGKGNYDIYVVFVERALRLLNDRGRLGFILPHKFFNAQYGEPLRSLLAQGRHLAEIVHFGDQQVFANATTYTCLLFLARAGRDEFRFEKVTDLAAWRARLTPRPAPAAPPNIGRGHPNSGDALPYLGNALPYLGNASPYSGNTFPNIGEPSPNVGEPAPNIGEPLPNVGEPLPNVGESAPNIGEPLPNVGEPLPNVGEPAPNVGEPSPALPGQTPGPDTPPRDLGSRAALLPAAGLDASEWNFAIGAGAGLFEKLRAMPVKLGDIASIFVGLQTSADTVFLFKDCMLTNAPLASVHSKELDKIFDVESALLKPVVRSGSIGRYWARPTALVLFPYRFTDGKAELLPEDELKKNYPQAWTYLSTNKKLLSLREHGKFADAGWYQLYPKNLNLWEQPKIMLPYMITRLAAFYDEGNSYFVNVTTGGFGVIADWQYGSMKYLTGLLNSRLLDWFMRDVSTTFHGGYFAANKQFLVQLPIRPITFTDATDRGRHDRLVALVETMLALHHQLAAARSSHEQTALPRQIAATDRQIDRLVYELYDLTAQEINIVESGS